jgi:Fic/DOC family N-terminal
LSFKPSMKRSLQGRYVTVATAGESFKAFVPAPLPPRPAIDWTPALRGRFDAALVALGRLDAVTDLLPDAALLLYSFVRKEAVLSSARGRATPCSCRRRPTKSTRA